MNTFFFSDGLKLKSQVNIETAMQCSARSHQKFPAYISKKQKLFLSANNKEYAYRMEVQSLAAWCNQFNLSLNVRKTKEMTVKSKCVTGFKY